MHAHEPGVTLEKALKAGFSSQYNYLSKVFSYILEYLLTSPMIIKYNINMY